jgi:hypothetical protein
VGDVRGRPPFVAAQWKQVDAAQYERGSFMKGN